MINVIIVDDHELVRTGIHRLLEDAGGIEVIGEACSGEAGIEMARELNPDVVLMDISMPGIGGLEATRKLRQVVPGIPVIVLTVHTDAPFPGRLLHAGAVGYLSKGCSVDEMVHAIAEVHEGRRYISPSIAQNIALSTLDEEGENPFTNLSERELQVLLMLVQGQSVPVISERLSLSPKTVSTYRYRVFDKLGVRNDAGLTRLALRYGLLDDVSSS